MRKAFILFGPSGSGKSYTKEWLLKNNKAKALIMTTTRKPRKGEVNGKDYYFVSKENFKKMEQNNQFLFVVKISESWLYGLTFSEIEKYKNENIVVDFINEEYAILFFNKIKNTHQSFLCFFEIPLEQRIKIFKERGCTQEEIKIRLDREEKFNGLSSFTKKIAILFDNFSTNLQKISSL